MDGRRRRDRRRPRSARIATERTRSWRRTIAKSSIYKFNVPATCGKCHTDGRERHSCRAFTGRRLRAAMGRLRCARIATGFTRSRRTSIRILRSRSRICRADTCARCHEGVRLSQEFGVPGTACRATLDSYHGLASRGRVGGGGELLELPRRAQYSAVERSAVDDQQGQSGRDLRQVPQGSDAEVHADQGARGSACRSTDIGSIAVRWVRLVYLVLIFGRDWRDVPAQLRLSGGSKAMARRGDAESADGAHDDESALAAPDSADELHRPGDYGICAQVPGFVVCARAGDGREAAQHDSSRGRSGADRRGNLSRVLSCGCQRRAATDLRLSRRGRRMLRCVGTRCATTWA